MNIIDEKNYEDYDFVDEYPDYHAWQTSQIIKDGYSFELNNFSIENNKLNIHDKLNPNQVLLYDLIFENKPKSVFEVGFGYANHLYSIQNILPDTKVYGCEISQKQFNQAIARYTPFLNKENLYLDDFLTCNCDKYDFVYSNAVLMHLSTQKQKDAIIKMFDISNRYIFLLDGKLHIPNLEEFLSKLPRIKSITYFDDFALKNWTHNHVPPLLIEK